MVPSQIVCTKFEPYRVINLETTKVINLGVPAFSHAFGIKFNNAVCGEGRRHRDAGCGTTNTCISALDIAIHDSPWIIGTILPSLWNFILKVLTEHEGNWAQLHVIVFAVVGPSDRSGGTRDTVDFHMLRCRTRFEGGKC